MFNDEYWKNELIQSCCLIDENLSLIRDDNRGLIASNVLNSLRNLVEAVACYVYTKKNKENAVNRYEIIGHSISYIKKNSKFRFLRIFHDCLQASLSHYNLYGEYAERMLLKYFEFLIKIKLLFKNDFGIIVLNNLNKIPLDLDSNLESYYNSIKDIVNISHHNSKKFGTNTFYIRKKKTIYIKEILFYEYTLTDAFDDVSKFDRFIAYSKIDMFENYAVRCSFEKKFIKVFGKDVPLMVIVDYWIAIRPCELDKFAKIFGLNQKNSRTDQYERLMDYIKNNHISISEILEFADTDYNEFMNTIIDAKKKSSYLIELLNYSRKFLHRKIVGYNTVKYLANIFTNSIIKNQLSNKENPKVSNLFLKNGVLVFDKTPYSGSLIKHNPLFNILINLFNYKDYEDDIFANHIINESNKTASIYIGIKDSDLDEADRLIQKYNKRIPSFQGERYLERFGKNVYIRENEVNSIKIIKNLISRTNIINFPNYSTYIDSFLKNGTIQFDDKEKEKAFKEMFKNSSLFCIYGAAGTGKSTLISKELKALGQISKLCLTNTHAALQNMVKKIDDTRVHYKTIKSFIANKDIQTKYDIVVIDECSTISSKDMHDVLTKIETKLMILAGDIYQLPAIQFGNWFALLRNFIKKYSYTDLFHIYRCKEGNILIEVWDSVRNIKPNMQEMFVSYRFSHIIDESIFKKTNSDEIILALNYDGLYGINNLNRILQINNPNNEIIWKQHVFKIGDPIIFNDTSRFDGYIYNNLKGVIKDVRINPNQSIEFTLEVDTILNPLIRYSNFIFVSNLGEDKSLIKLTVLNATEDDYDKDTNDSNKIPFEIAYAISIHKSQGLEYNSVKLIITREVEEAISHNVFYTAITRAKRFLTIYWSPESETAIIKSFKTKNVIKDVKILENKYKLIKK